MVLINLLLTLLFLYFSVTMAFTVVLIAEVQLTGRTVRLSKVNKIFIKCRPK